MASTNMIQQLARYKAWANQDLLSVLESMPDTVETADRTVALVLLNHTHIVDCIFRARLEGVEHSYTSVTTAPPDTIEDLRSAINETDRWYVDYADSIAEKELDEKIRFRYISGKEATMSRGEILLHVLLHGTSHRGGVGVLLQKNSVAAPSDNFTDFLDKV